MSPEYTMHGEFSDKSDIFSFGVIILEILSGKRNSGFDQYSCDGEDFLNCVSTSLIKLITKFV